MILMWLPRFRRYMSLESPSPSHFAFLIHHNLKIEKQTNYQNTQLDGIDGYKNL